LLCAPLGAVRSGDSWPALTFWIISLTGFSKSQVSDQIIATLADKPVMAEKRWKPSLVRAKDGTYRCRIVVLERDGGQFLEAGFIRAAHNHESEEAALACATQKSKELEQKHAQLVSA
jgi:hypothetical protein